MYIEYYILNPIRLNKIIKLDWFNLWIKKSDYINNYYINIKGKYEIIDNSIDYYVTIIEMSIFYLKDYSNYYDYAYRQYGIIIDNGMYTKDDIKERDFAEYLKYLFYKDYDIDYIYSLIDKSKSIFNYYLVVARLIFPSYYLFYLDRLIINNKDYDKLENIVNKTTNYEKYLKCIVERMNNYLTKKIVLPF